MPVILGRNSFVRIGEESTYGAGSSSANVFNRIVSTSLGRNQERSQTTHLSTSDAAFSQGFFDGMELAGGSLEIPIYYEGNGILLKAAIGSVVDGGGPPYSHTYRPTAVLPSLEITVQRGSGNAELFEGCVISTMSLSVEAGGEMTASFEIIAETAQARSGSLTPSYGDGVQVLHYQAGTMSFNSVNYSLRSLDFNLDNKIDRRNLLGSKLTAQPLITDIREVTMTVTCDLEDDNLYNAQLAGTQSDCEITFTGTDADADTFKLKLFNAVITSYSDEINTVGRIERTIEFQGLADSSDPAFEIVIVNQDISGIGN